MTVYVDNMSAGYRRMKMCHMIADNSEELLQMADTVGVKRKWIQHPGTYREHFDICQSKRKLAIQAGAVEVTSRKLAKILQERKQKYVVKLPPKVTVRACPGCGFRVSQTEIVTAEFNFHCPRCGKSKQNEFQPIKTD